jgi:hypothetical protein
MATANQNSAEKNAPWFTKPGMTDRLVVLHGEGVPFGNIAGILREEYGVPVTKNGVVGKARRMKLARRKPLEPQPKLPRKPRKKKPRPLPPLSDGRPGSPRHSIPLPPPPSMMMWLPPLLPAVRLPPEQLRIENLPVLALKPGECKFADGEYPYQFCGREPLEGCDYCAEHWRLMHERRRP